MATLKYKTPEGEWKKVSIGGGGSTEEVYVGSDAPTDENVKVWIDPTGTPSGGNGGGLETRILYVPEFTAGSELTDDEKAYNVETCQKLLAGTARAVIALGGAAYLSSENIVDFNIIGLEGIYIKFGWSLYLSLDYVIVGADGDILKTEAAKPGDAIVIPYSQSVTESSLYTDVMIASLDDKLPLIYCKSGISSSDPFILCNAINISNGYIFIEGYYRRDRYEDTKVLGMITEEGVLLKIYALPTYITLDSASQQENIAWWNSIKASGTQIWHTPYIKGVDAYYYPISMKQETNQVRFVIYRNSTFEEWKLTSDGIMTQITE